MSVRQQAHPPMSPAVALTWLKTMGISETAFAAWTARVEAAARGVAKALQERREALQVGHRRSAEAALAFQRKRVSAWKAADIPRIRMLNEAVGPATKLSAAEEEWMTEVLARKPPGRPGGNSGPQTVRERIAAIVAWSQMPIGTRNERRLQLRSSHLFPPILAEAYASELARQTARDTKDKPLHMSAHEAAEDAVADLVGISAALLRCRKSGLVKPTNDVGVITKLRAWIETGAEE